MTLIQRGNSLWSALYSQASFNQNTTPAVLIKHRRAKVFTDVFYNVDCVPLTRTQRMWAICLILCKVSGRVESTLKLKSHKTVSVSQYLFRYIEQKCCLIYVYIFYILPLTHSLKLLFFPNCNLHIFYIIPNLLYIEVSTWYTVNINSFLLIQLKMP